MPYVFYPVIYEELIELIFSVESSPGFIDNICIVSLFLGVFRRCCVSASRQHHDTSRDETSNHVSRYEYLHSTVGKTEEINIVIIIHVHCMHETHTGVSPHPPNVHFVYDVTLRQYKT